MYKGLDQPTKYDYKIVLEGHARPSGQVPMVITREFTSKFEVGECWGYNKFVQI